MTDNRTTILLALTLLVFSGALAGCSGNARAASRARPSPMADVQMMPPEVQAAPQVVLEAYQFAVANPETLQQLPCYCGCGSMGHDSNYACYVQSTSAQGELVFDNHALGCSICVDITQDAMRLLEEGKDLSEIRSYVDETYAQYGPSNMPDSP